MSGSGALINKEVLISLVISTLGRTTPLERLFESLLTQEHKNFEVIVVDQNRDNRLDPLFGEGRWSFPLRRQRTPGETGLSRGRNTGWEIAEGSIIVFPDDDCWYPSWFLARGLFLMAATGADFLSGRAADEDGRSINGRYELTAQPINRANVWTTGIEWTIFFKRTALMAVSGFDPEIGIGASTPWQSCEGQDLMLRALANRLKGYYDPSIYGYHATFDIEAEAGIQGKGRKYGRGIGYVLRVHQYGLWSALKWIGRPVIGLIVFFVRGKFKHVEYYRNVAIGRFEGWSGRLIGSPGGPSDKGPFFWHSQGSSSGTQNEAAGSKDQVLQIATPKPEAFVSPRPSAPARTSHGESFGHTEESASTASLPRVQQRLTINGRFLTQNLTGVQRYCREIVSSLDNLLQDEQWRAALTAKIIVPSAGAHCLDLHAIGVQPTLGRVGGPAWTQCVLPILSRGVLLSLGNIGPVVSSNHVICIHDLNTYLAPESYSTAFRIYYRTILPILAKRAARVVTVSNFSARMLDEFKLCPLDKITVIPNGHEHVQRWRPDRSVYASSLSGNRPFVFVLGSRAWHKNVQILFDIARELDSLGLDLLVAGAPNRHFSPVEQSAAPNVRMLGFVTDDDLAALYRNALCFAFPSLTEGFGLPALEAMALGCPVIASNCASMPEVCGSAALYADPKSPRAWLDQIKRLHADQDLAASLRAEGCRQAARFSWTKSAQLYLNLIMSLVPGAAD